MITLSVRFPRGVVNPGASKTRQVTRRGMFVQSHDGRLLELFRIGVLAEALHLEKSTILKLEHAGIFPRPIYVVRRNDERTRWYSAAQVLRANELVVRALDDHTRGKRERRREVIGVLREEFE